MWSWVSLTHKLAFLRRGEFELVAERYNKKEKKLWVLILTLLLPNSFEVIPYARNCAYRLEIYNLTSF